VKFTSHRGRIEVRLDHGEGMARIRVADNGQGIDPAFLPHVFDRFWQGDSSTTRAHGGLGLDLAIVRYLTETHGGRVRADSPGHGLGATFTVELPLGRDGGAASHERAERARWETPVARSGDPTPALRDAHVLVVDDEEDSRDLVVSLLAGASANVVAASSTAEAMRSIIQRPPQLVVCDIGMPHEDGYSLIRQLRALDGASGRIPVIALTAYAREEDRRRTMSAGFQAHIAKPFEARELLTAAADLISKSAR
jgi:CheY-like chemotaxis protein